MRQGRERGGETMENVRMGVPVVPDINRNLGMMLWEGGLSLPTKNNSARSPCKHSKDENDLNVIVVTL